MICKSWGQNRKMRKAYARMARLDTRNSRRKLLWHTDRHVIRKAGFDYDRRWTMEA